MKYRILLTTVMTFAFAAPAPASAEITLPEGFTVTVFADELGATRHLAVREDGVVYASLRQLKDGHGIVALADDDGDGTADRKEYFGDTPGTGLAIHDGYLYFSSNTEVMRYRLGGERMAGDSGDASSEDGAENAVASLSELVPSSDPERIVTGFIEQRSHATKPMTFDGAGNMYVTVGAPSNACQEQARTPRSPGLEPCPQLELQAGIWRFDVNKSGQVHGEDGERYATGIRNGLAVDWNPAAGALYFANHGRDQLSDLFPQHFTTEQNAELPAEEFHRAEHGSDHGWPYTYWDAHRGARMRAPEYGGDGEARAEAGKYRDPLVAIPGHWAPNDLVFYTGNAFPEQYKNGAFIAFHGSWNRAPLPQAGYNVVFIPMNAEGEVTGEWSVFADGFQGRETLRRPGEANYRPNGLAVGPDGALYVADDTKGRVWKIVYTGN